MANASAIPLITPHTWMGTSEGKQTTRLHQLVLVEEALYQAQLPSIRRFVEEQARQLADMVLGNRSQSAFYLPERVICFSCRDGEQDSLPVPPEARKQSLGSWIDRLERQAGLARLNHKLTRLEQNPDPAISAAAGLIRYITARHIVQDLLPFGHSVSYYAIEGEEIPSIPYEAVEGTVSSTSYANRFFLPQWVSFDERGNLLVSSIEEAEASLAAMQQFMQYLQLAAAIAPYMVASEEYQRKRLGMLGQLVNQGRAMGLYWVRQIVHIIENKEKSKKLERGLSISLPYFDDRDLMMKMYDFEIIPRGRVEFIPAFVVLSIQREFEKIVRNPAFSFSTRKYLLIELDILEQSFRTDDPLSNEAILNR